MKRFSRVLVIILFILVIFLGLFLFAIGLIGYPTSRAIMNQFSRDGSLESFTVELYQSMRVGLSLVGAALMTLCVLGLLFFRKTEKILRRLYNRGMLFWKRFCDDSKKLWFDIFHPGFARWEWLILFLLVMVGFMGSWIWVKKPMLHDESYTFIAFARRPFINLISDYHLPNNHILNSILIHLLYKFFGNPSPVIVRLPSLIAGVISIPLTYFWARKQYGRFAGFVAAGLVGYLPWIKFQSTNGRGYLLMAMFTLLMLILAERVREKKDRAAWLGLILVTTLNFYTLPITLYPFGIIVLWLFISALRRDISQDYESFWDFFRYLMGYGVLSGVLVFLLYSPIFVIGSGWDSFFNNRFVESLTWNDFIQTLPIRLNGTIADWQMLVPLWFSIVLGVGVFLSLVFHRFSKGTRTPLLFCALVALVLIFIIQRPNPWSRIWTYLLPMVLTWAAAGWFLALQGLLRDEKKHRSSIAIMSAGFMVVVLVLSGRFISQNLTYFNGEKGQEETVTLALQPLVQSNDIVITSAGYRPALYYYFDMYGLPVETIVNPDFESDWHNLYIAVDDRYDETPEELMSETPIAPEICKFETADPVYSYGHYKVFICSRE